jgi:mlo protein
MSPPAELMLLGVISLLLSQTAHLISEICVPSSVFSSKFYICSEDDFHHLRHLEVENQTSVTNPVSGGQAKHVCSEVIKWRDLI